MAFNVKNAEADRLVRELMDLTGENLTDAVLVSVRERLERERFRRGPSIGDRLRVLVSEVAVMPVLDDRPSDEIIGYDSSGIPT